MAKQKNQKDRKFIGGSGREYIFPDNGQVINCFIKFDDLAALPRTEKGYIRFVVAERKEPDQYKNTHYFYEDDFVPSKKKETSETPPATTPDVNTEDNDSDDLPF